MSDKRLARINSLLLIIIIAINCYVIIAPLLPALQFWYKDRFANRQRAALEAVVNKSTDKYQGPNKLIIPEIFTDQPILEGPNIYTANKGIWRLPTSSTPDKGGNTVLIGHRFLYSKDPAVFYNLDKVKLGDSVGVYWNNQKYTYLVKEVKVVTPQQTDIEAATSDSRLTIYTCTPLWSSKNRLVVIAEKTGGSNE